ncbi:hypothetical protein SAMN00017405_2072 [Desulfonispora thiosulfatigenes DSM 11270]|uniref:Uncharacterized protein n=1 Tax=Desulfonispora thiosulfatigenes DSM 11270 TaxID=656914 RepID=A0A1W1VGY4_DESTI|nr:hypothetical protein [Desulfonispora thiosulfatigenes]SMB92637.1 hypothetical protein SAMN00017405_2072 [Desulfonispora thiosulfatigenes DSM 11270]
MNNLPLVVLIFQIIPESIAMIFLATSILNNWIAEKKYILFIFGVLEGLFIFFLKTISISFGVHTIIAIFSLALWIYFITKKSFTICILSASIVSIILMILELIVVEISINFFGLEVQYILNNYPLRIILGSPQILILFLLGVILNKIFWKKRTNKLN